VYFIHTDIPVPSPSLHNIQFSKLQLKIYATDVGGTFQFYRVVLSNSTGWFFPILQGGSFQFYRVVRSNSTGWFFPIIQGGSFQFYRVFLSNSTGWFFPILQSGSYQFYSPLKHTYMSQPAPTCSKAV
jgi:hypothetical protein